MNATGQAVDSGEKKGLNGAASEGDATDYEALASEIGWRPLDKFRGDPSKHVDAKTYYEKGSLVLPLVKQQRDEAKKETDAVRKELAQVKSSIADFQKFTEADRDRKVTALQSEIAALKDTRAAAVESGDKAAFRQADDAIDERKEALAAAKTEPKKEAAKDEPKGDPDFEAWVAENDWYKTDKRLKLRADIIGANLIADDPNLRGKALFKAVSEEMERVDGELSGTKRAGPQRGGQASGGKIGAKTFDNLQPDFKKGFEKMTKAGFKMTKEQYVAQCGPEAWGA